MSATVNADGQLVVDGRAVPTPSCAAQIAMADDRPIDGWKRWKVSRLAGRSLAEIRDAAAR